MKGVMKLFLPTVMMDYTQMESIEDGCQSALDWKFQLVSFKSNYKKKKSLISDSSSLTEDVKNALKSMCQQN